MRVLVTGASGFLAAAIMEALRAKGHTVRACVRPSRRLAAGPATEVLPIDHARATSPDDWSPLLNGVDAVVNCSGILRQRGRDTFEDVHFASPKALVEACLKVGVPKFVQISALGDPADGEFVASKHRFDEWLINSGMPATVIRPSVVVSTRGSYGGTSLLRALAAMPWFMAIPGKGSQLIQPVLLEDLAELVTVTLDAAVARGEILYATGPRSITLRQYLTETRAWLGAPPPLAYVGLPTSLVTAATWAGDVLHAGPVSRPLASMLKRGNVAPPGALEQTMALSQWRPRDLSFHLAETPAFVQDRWHARLYLLRPIVILTLALTWIVSAIAGFTAPPASWQGLLDGIGVAREAQHALVIGASTVNLILGVALLANRYQRVVLSLMLVSVLAYTAVLGILVPSFWLDPLGALLKNLAVIALLLIALATGDSR